MGIASLNVHVLNGIPLNGRGPVFAPAPPPSLDIRRDFSIDAECRIFPIPAEIAMEVCESQAPMQICAENRLLVVAKTPLR